MILRVLLAESEPEEALFLQDVLSEIECGRYWTNWVQIEVLHTGSSVEAVAILANDLIDIVLLDLDLIDSQGVETFRRIHGAAPQVPIVLLVGSGDHALAVRMVRDGAQDFMIRKEVDCEPLAHVIWNAVERHRRLSAAQAGAITDSLTGLPNRGAFLTFADRDRKLAERLGRRLMIVVVELKQPAEVTSAYGEQRLDLMLVEAADYLRSLSGPTDFLARIGPARFALTIFDTEAESVEEAWARIHTAARDYRMGAAIFDAERPATLDTLLEQAQLDLAPNALAMRR